MQHVIRLHHHLHLHQDMHRHLDDVVMIMMLLHRDHVHPIDVAADIVMTIHLLLHPHPLVMIAAIMIVMMILVDTTGMMIDAILAHHCQEDHEEWTGNKINSILQTHIYVCSCNMLFSGSSRDREESTTLFVGNLPYDYMEREVCCITLSLSYTN